MAVEVNKEPKNKRGVSVLARINLSKMEVEQARFDILEEKRKDSAKQIGLHLYNSLELFNPIEDEKNIIEEARLVCIKEDDYKQMVALVNNTLIDSGASDIVVSNIRKLLIDVIN